MSFRGLKVPVIVLTFAALLFAGLFAQKALRDSRVMDPLHEQLSAIEGVREVLIEQRDGLTDVSVELALVDNIGDTYARIERVASTYLDGGLGEIRLVDDRSPELEEAFYHLHFALQEAVATGRFAALEQAGEQAAERAGTAAHRIFVRESFVAVQLVASDGHYLYEVVRRPPLTPSFRLLGTN